MVQSRVEQRLPRHRSETLPRTMPQLLSPGMPEGAIRINPVVSRLSKDGHVIWFLGADNYFSYPADDSAGHRLALATLMTNGHARPSQIQKTLSIAPRSLVRWRKQLDAQRAGSFYQLRVVRGAVVLNVETSAQCQLLLDEGHSIATTARLANIKDTTLRKAIAAGRITKPGTTRQAAAPPPASSPPPTSCSAVSSAACPPSAPTASSPTSTAI